VTPPFLFRLSSWSLRFATAVTEGSFEDCRIFGEFWPTVEYPRRRIQYVGSVRTGWHYKAIHAVRQLHNRFTAADTVGQVSEHPRADPSIGREGE